MVLEERSLSSEPNPRIVTSLLDDVLFNAWSVMIMPGLTTNENDKKDVETSGFKPINTNKKRCNDHNIMGRIYNNDGNTAKTQQNDFEKMFAMIDDKFENSSTKKNVCDMFCPNSRLCTKVVRS